MIVGNVGRKDHSHPIYTYINSHSQIDDTSNQIIQGQGLPMICVLSLMKAQHNKMKRPLQLANHFRLSFK